MPIEDLAGDRRIVFARHCQDDAAPAQRLQITAEIAVSLALRRADAEPDALQAVIADDAAPERVVEVDDQRFFSASRDGTPCTEQGAAVIGQKAGAEGDIAVVVKARETGRAACWERVC